MDYDWTTFRDAARALFGQLRQAYAFGDLHSAPKFNAAMLRYINAVELPAEQSITEFVGSQFHTRLELPEQIGPQEEGEASDSALDLSLTYPLSTPRGRGSLRIASGFQAEKPSVIWELFVRSTEDDSPQNETEFDSWIEQAHVVIEDWFFTLIRGELQSQFEGGAQ